VFDQVGTLGTSAEKRASILSARSSHERMIWPMIGSTYKLQSGRVIGLAPVWDMSVRAHQHHYSPVNMP